MIEQLKSTEILTGNSSSQGFLAASLTSDTLGKLDNKIKTALDLTPSEVQSTLLSSNNSVLDCTSRGGKKYQKKPKSEIRSEYEFIENTFSLESAFDDLFISLIQNNHL